MAYHSRFPVLIILIVVIYFLYKQGLLYELSIPPSFLYTLQKYRGQGRQFSFVQWGTLKQPDRIIFFFVP